MNDHFSSQFIDFYNSDFVEQIFHNLKLVLIKDDLWKLSIGFECIEFGETKDITISYIIMIDDNEFGSIIAVEIVFWHEWYMRKRSWEKSFIKMQIIDKILKFIEQNSMNILNDISYNSILNR